MPPVAFVPMPPGAEWSWMPEPPRKKLSEATIIHAMPSREVTILDRLWDGPIGPYAYVLKLVGLGLAVFIRYDRQGRKRWF